MTVVNESRGGSRYSYADRLATKFSRGNGSEGGGQVADTRTGRERPRDPVARTGEAGSPGTVGPIVPEVS